METLLPSRLGERLNARGLGLARCVQAMIRCRGDLLAAVDHAMATWPDQLEVHRVLRTAVSAGTLSGTWGGTALAPSTTIVGEFVSASTAASVLGRLQGLHRIPPHTRVARETGGATLGWIGEGLPAPASELAYDAVLLEPSKAGGVIALSEELARSSAPAAEQLVRDSLVRGVAAFLDKALLDPSLAASSAHPASLTSGLTPVTSSGSTVAAIGADIVALVDALVNGGNVELRDLYLIMSPRTAARISAKREAAGAAPTLTIAGGTLSGIPVVISTSSNWSVSGGGQMTLIDANEILLADDGRVELDVSREASIQLNSAPSAGASTLTSLFQMNLAAVKATRWISWTTRHGAAAAAAYVDATAY